MARKTIQVVGDEFYNTNPTFLKEFEDIYSKGISETDARYIDSETNEAQKYTARQILDRNAPSALYISGKTVVAK